MRSITGTAASTSAALGIAVRTTGGKQIGIFQSATMQRLFEAGFFRLVDTGNRPFLELTCPPSKFWAAHAETHTLDTSCTQSSTASRNSYISSTSTR